MASSKREQMAGRAGEILKDLLATRTLADERVAWSRMWDLMREAKAAKIDFDSATERIWWYSEDRTDAMGAIWMRLNCREYSVSVSWPPDDPQFGTHLPAFLNWAGVFAEPKPAEEAATDVPVTSGEVVRRGQGPRAPGAKRLDRGR
jgi:hypothetical protein